MFSQGEMVQKVLIQLTLQQQIHIAIQIYWRELSQDIAVVRPH